MTIPFRQDRKVRRLIAGLPHGWMLLLAAICMLAIAVGAAHAKDAPPDKARRIAATATTFTPAAGAPVGEADRTPLVLSVDVTDCDVVAPRVAGEAPILMTPASLRLDTGVAR